MTTTRGPCPCGSQRTFASCCGPFIDRIAEPPTAEALMRSRYTAFATGATTYLLESWHPDTRPPELSLSPELRWIGLKIIDTTAGGPLDEQGGVHFVARYKIRGRAGRLEERSRFVRAEGRWLYLSGEVTRE